MPDFPEGKETSLFLPGAVGVLEAVASPPTSEISREHALILCHPHPLFGGTMENKVVTTLFRQFSQWGFHVVRFNYRGVGKSEGTFDNTVGETEDLLAVARWLQKEKPSLKLWLAGFSFGAVVAAKGAAHLPCEQLISLAPPVHHYDFEKIPPLNIPWLVIQPEEDEVVPPAAVYDWVAHAHNPSLQLIRMPGASHFFHGQLVKLKEVLNHTFRFSP